MKRGVQTVGVQCPGRRDGAAPWLVPGSLRRRSRPLLIGLLGFALIVALPARSVMAWGRLAHRSSAKLAETRLTPQARAKIRELLDPGESLADASTWADENNRAIPGSAAWHYVNVPISAPRYSPRDCHGDNCIVAKLEEFRRVLADPQAPKARRRMALRYVIHLVQDLHQPMHVGDRRDRGGNALQLQFYRDDSTNLHQVWDSGLLRQRYRHESDLVRDLVDLAKQPEAGGWREGRVEDWANESLDLARQAYRIPGTNSYLRSGMRIGREYEDANLPSAVRRLAQSGVRLAVILNRLLDEGRGEP